MVSTIGPSLASPAGRAADPAAAVAREAAGLLESVVAAAEGALGAVNAAEVGSLCAKLVAASLCAEEALRVAEALLSAGGALVDARTKAELLAAGNALLAWTLRSGGVARELESVKLALRVQFALVKGEKDRIRSNPAECVEMARLVLAVSQQRVNEDELIRLLLRSIFFFLQVPAVLPLQNRPSPRLPRSTPRFSSTASRWPRCVCRRARAWLSSRSSSSCFFPPKIPSKTCSRRRCGKCSSRRTRI